MAVQQWAAALPATHPSLRGAPTQGSFWAQMLQSSCHSSRHAALLSKGWPLSAACLAVSCETHPLLTKPLPCILSQLFSSTMAMLGRMRQPLSSSSSSRMAMQAHMLQALSSSRAAWGHLQPAL